MGSALMGSLHLFMFCLTEGPFGFSREPTFIFPKVPGPPGTRRAKRPARCSINTFLHI